MIRTDFKESILRPLAQIYFGGEELEEQVDKSEFTAKICAGKNKSTPKW